MLDLPNRYEKPRKTGITSIHDTYLTFDHLSSILNDHGHLIDYAKFGVGTAYCTKYLSEKIDLYKTNNVIPYFGGTLFEKFYSQNKLDEFCTYLKENGISTIEVSTGTVDISLPNRVSIVNELKNDFHVITEIGSKDNDNIMAPSDWLNEISTLFHAGAEYIITEGRDSGTAGLFRSSGELREGLFSDIKKLCDVSKIIFEAPTSQSQMFFINSIGSNVNLGNINPMHVLLLETQRLGLRCETFDVK